MQWENMTATTFKQAVDETGVCVIAAGVMEKHSEHLPLGTDFLCAPQIACLAAEKEPAVVFPPFYFGEIYEARCFPGTVTLEPTLLLNVLRGVLDEIGRNGFRKIVLYNGHGGNTPLLHFLTQCALWEKKPYSVYMPVLRMTPEREERRAEVCKEPGGHACEYETSVLLATHPDLVKMDAVPPSGGEALKRLEHLPPTLTGIGWYADYPDHYMGDARSSTQEKGLVMRDLHVDSLAEYIAAVKKDAVVPALEREFFSRVDGLRVAGGA